MITERIAHFVSDVSSTDIPQEAFRFARLGITDFLGVALAGSKDEVGAIIAECVNDMGGVAQSGIIGKGFKVSPYLSALANGTMGHALDYDDISFTFAGHPSVSLAPAVLAIGESINASGADILMAYIVGFEVGVCLGSPVSQSHYMQGWHSTNTVGSLAATASVARLLMLDAHQIRMALGIAASLAGGLRQNFGTMTKPLHAGNSAANGVLAALLAQRGFTSDENIIEAPLGYARVFGCREEIDWEKASEHLGKSFIIATEGIGFKPYPSCGGTHAAIDAALQLRDEYQPDIYAIAEIEVGMSPHEKSVLIHHHPKTGLEGKFSLEYCVGRAIIDGKVTLSNFTDEQVNQPEVQHLIDRTKCVERYPMPLMGLEGGGRLSPQSVTIKLNDGREYSRETIISKGMPENSMTTEQFESKYKDCATLVLNEQEVQKSLVLLRNLETLENVRELMEIVTQA